MTESTPAWGTPPAPVAVAAELDLKDGLKTFRAIMASVAVLHLVICAYFILDDLSSSNDFLNGLFAVLFGIWAILPATVLLLLWLSTVRLHRKGKTVLVYIAGIGEILGGPVAMAFVGVLVAA